MTIDHLINCLRVNRYMRTRQEVLAFDNALAALASHPNSEVEGHLAELFLTFDDLSEHKEVMWGLVHYVDSFDAGTEIRAFGEAAPSLVDNAITWVRILTNGWLNDEVARATLREILPSLPLATRTVIHTTLKEAGSISEEEQAKVKAVLADN